MFQYLVELHSTVYAQIVLFLILGAFYLFSQRRLHPFRILAVAVIRLAIVVALFIYLFLNWSSEVNPSLREASVLGMFLINLYMLWHVVLIRMELPYREALEACAQDPGSPELFHNVVRTGRRFYNMRYFPLSLVSGGSIKRFLHGIAVEQLRHDFRHILQKRGVSLDIDFQMAHFFLKRRLHEEDYPPEFKNFMDKVIDNFFSHAWIQEEMNRFLSAVLESPEELYRSELIAREEEAAES
ncbi:MAG: hypothetical protein JRI59_07610 [Deltaproteobacteria bacterium]|nr:hypothetical protein [Deltaproteobacteria bacterium]